MDDDREPSPPDLRPVIARLREIERKCASMGSRNEEFPVVQQRVASVIARLEAGKEPSGEPLRFAAIARELFPVAHVFESVGFMSVGREVSHVERALRELDPAADEGPGKPPRGPATQPVSSAAVARPSPEPAPRADEERRHPRSVPLPLIVAALVLAVAVAAAVSIVLGVGPAARLAGRAPTAPLPAATPAPTPAPSPTPLAHVEPTAAPAPVTAGPAPGARLADAVSQARLALARGEIEEALERLSVAALVDRTDERVVEIADTLVGHFVASAGEAADRADWEEAARRLERAQRLAMRFGLDEARIEDAEKRIAEMERYRVVSPRDTRALLAAVGREADVTLNDGSTRRGRIGALEGATLVLDVVREVGGGGLHYSEELPLADIAAVKIYER